MAGIAILMPFDTMTDRASAFVKREAEKNIMCIKTVDSTNASIVAREAVSEGASVIVSRGQIADIIKEMTNIPVVDMKFSGQEMAMLVTKAKKMVNKKEPVIGIIGRNNIFPDLSMFDELFGIRLIVENVVEYYLADVSVKKVMGLGADVVIGGRHVVEAASSLGIPSLFYEATDDSIRNALANAQSVIYAIETEQKLNAQFETILQSTFSGIIKINRDQEITVVNRIVASYLDKSEKKMVGEKLEKYLPDISTTLIQEVLDGKNDMYSTSTQIKGSAFSVIISAIQTEGDISGAIISLSKISKDFKKKEEENIRQMYLKGYSSQFSFKDYKSREPVMKNCLELARKYAVSKHPIIIYGETGTNKEMLAQCIHNNSRFCKGPFVSVNCSGMTPEMQLERLFGNPYNPDLAIQAGALAGANEGTILIHDVYNLAPVCQYRLFRALKYDALVQNDIERSLNLNIRMIFTSKKNLWPLVREEKFREDLYYLISGLEINYPPLRERPEDLMDLVEKIRKNASYNYSRFVKISDEAMEEIKGYSWKGNEYQLESFCERMILGSNKRVIDGDYVRWLLEEMNHDNDDEGEVVQTYANPQAARVAEALEQCGGNRAQAAEMLGISTTTLWRYMKKYGIGVKY